jgi:hypothetical protein
MKRVIKVQHLIVGLNQELVGKSNNRAERGLPSTRQPNMILIFDKLSDSKSRGGEAHRLTLLSYKQRSG